MPETARNISQGHAVAQQLRLRRTGRAGRRIAWPSRRHSEDAWTGAASESRLGPVCHLDSWLYVRSISFEVQQPLLLAFPSAYHLGATATTDFVGHHKAALSLATREDSGWGGSKTVQPPKVFRSASHLFVGKINGWSILSVRKSANGRNAANGRSAATCPPRHCSAPRTRRKAHHASLRIFTPRAGFTCSIVLSSAPRLTVN